MPPLKHENNNNVDRQLDQCLTANVMVKKCK